MTDSGRISASMENNKEVKNIVDHQRQHPVQAPLPQEYIHEDRFAPADNPLQPPRLQQLPAGASVGGGGEEEREASPDQASSEKLEGCCHAHGCLRGLVR
ncbi:unnamed protein product [Microthlaspi erraticum]|uniref:Uncharacterized protein n=1 Tax=Microthlaspi erraticum TaxID=1685480 RepID=A0A6D2IRM1_9BRAS|nr:unnamed protein product [Microthlaspi erraticum]